MVGGPWAWHHSRHHRTISGRAFIESSEAERKWRERWLCGHLMPSIFVCQYAFSSVSNPARAPAAPRMASPKAQDTSSQNYPFLTPHHPPRLSSTGFPRGWAVVTEAKFTLWEWLQWQQCVSACPLGLALICWALLSHCSRRLGPSLAGSQTGWFHQVDKSHKAHNSPCSIQRLCLRSFDAMILQFTHCLFFKDISLSIYRLMCWVLMFYKHDDHSSSIITAFKKSIPICIYLLVADCRGWHTEIGNMFVCPPSVCCLLSLWCSDGHCQCVACRCLLWDPSVS